MRRRRTGLALLASIWLLNGASEAGAQSFEPMALLVAALRAALPAGAELSFDALAGDPLRATGTIDGLRIVFAEPFLPESDGEPADATEAGLTEIAVAQVALSGLSPVLAADLLRVDSIAFDGFRAQMVGGQSLAIGQASYRDLPLLTALGLGGDMSTLSTGPMALTDITFTNPRDDSRVTARTMTIRTIDTGTVEGAVIEDLRGQIAEETVSIGRVDLPMVHGDRVEEFGTLGIQAAENPDGPADTEKLIGAFFDGVPEFTITDVLIEPAEPEVPEIRVGRMGWRVNPPVNGAPRQFSIDVTEVAAAIAGLPEDARAWLHGIGPELRLSLTAGGSWDNAERRLALAPLRLQAEEIAAVELRAEFTAIPSAQTLAGLPPGALGETLTLTPLAGLALTIEERGLLAASLDRLAALQGMTREDLATFGRAEIEGILGSGMAELAALLDPIVAFIHDPGRFTLAFEPTTAQPLAQLLMVGLSQPQLVLSQLRAVYEPPIR
jgi:hypothetical protein